MASPLRDGSFDVAETCDSSDVGPFRTVLAPPKLALGGQRLQGSSPSPVFR